ncbi:MAG TPA: D-2-hydroxyacid dehydrogenase [Bryobacteraceae bacterium]|nr:D-2-hydroxyacid dehydrogenase [Bryobacteraceae bacterium]
MRLLVIANPLARHLVMLERLPEETTITVSDRLEGLVDAAPEADVIFHCLGDGTLLRQIWPLARNVKWVHSMAAGVEEALFPELCASPVPLTNARGVHKRSLAEFVVAAILFFAKDLRRMLRNQAAARWEPFDIEELHGHVLGVVGYGEIGRASAELARAFGMEVRGVGRRHTRAERNALLAASDYVLVAAPATAETAGLIGETEIAVMKANAVLINVGRGPVVDERALVHALQRGRIRGAALDVFNEEPLPTEHPFWRLENVLLSPHCADHTPVWMENATELFLRNFEHFVRGKPLENIVDKQAGY